MTPAVVAEENNANEPTDRTSAVHSKDFVLVIE